jgi:hypothetical protein
VGCRGEGQVSVLRVWGSGFGVQGLGFRFRASGNACTFLVESAIERSETSSSVRELR